MRSSYPTQTTRRSSPSRLSSLAVVGLALGGLAFGCVSGGMANLRPEASNVTVVSEADRPLHCDVVDDILGRSTAKDETDARKGAENDLKNKAFALNGNYAVIIGNQSGPVGTTGRFEVALRAKAYRCEEPKDDDPFKTPPAAASAEAAPASAGDTAPPAASAATPAAAPGAKGGKGKKGH